jgi:hypothetical protein
VRTSVRMVSLMTYIQRTDLSPVEVAPVYDNSGQTTVLAAAEVALALIGLMVKTPVAALH